MSNSFNRSTMGFDPSSRKRPSGLPNPLPSKRPQRLSIGMDRLQLHSTDESIGPQRTVFNSNLQSQQLQQPLSLLSSSSQQSLQRRSTVMNVNVRRSSSIFGRPTITSSAMERFNANLPSPSNKKFVGEPKHIKENETQRRYLKSITEYLYETDYKGAKPPVNYRALGARDFQAMFKHLVNRLVPEYEFKKKFDEDVMEVIHLLHYPLADFFNQKHLLNIGAPHSIHVFYALLMWLTEMCRSMDEDIVQDEAGPLTQEQLFEAYSVECYHQYMDGNDNMNEQNKKLKDLFDRFDENNRKTVQEKTLSNLALQKELDHLNSIESPLNALKIKNQDSRQDIEKFEKYIEDKRAKIAKYDELNKRVRLEIEAMEENHAKMGKDIEAINARFIARNTSMEEIEQLESMYAQLQQENTALTLEVEETRKVAAEKELRLVKLRQEVEIIIKNYNDKIDSNLPMNDQLKITYKPDGTTIQQMLNYADIDHGIWPKLETISGQVKQEFDNIAEETMLLRETVDTLKTQVAEKKSELEALEERTLIRKKFHDDKHLKSQEENKAYNAMVDKYESSLEEKKEKANELIFNAKRALVEQQNILNNVSQVIEAEEKEVTSKFHNALTEIVSKVEKMKLDAIDMHMKTDQYKICTE